MRMRRIKVSGAAAAALVVTACGPTSSSSSGTPTGHPAAVSAGPTSAAAPATDQADLARLKRHINWSLGMARTPRPPAGASSSANQNDLVKVKQSAAFHAWQQAPDK
jgi:hypothetical protein